MTDDHGNTILPPPGDPPPSAVVAATMLETARALVAKATQQADDACQQLIDARDDLMRATHLLEQCVRLSAAMKEDPAIRVLLDEECDF